ncbi:MAG: hypothetical protein K0R00_2921 [Herbinix sp.]|nr:hypothetical protein [Herbinix sp.]
MKIQRRVVLILTIIFALMTISSLAFNYGLPLYIKKMGGFSWKDASAIGVIGSADGPTSILLSNSKYSLITTLGSLLMTLAGLTYLIFKKRKDI